MGFNSSQSNNAIQAIMGMGQTLSDTSIQSKQYETEAGASSTNAKLLEMSAEDAIQRGQEGAAKYGRAFSQAFGQTKDQIVGSGTDATKGSALNRLNDLSTGGALDELTIRNNAANEAFGYEQEANKQGTLSQLDLLKQKATLGSGLLTTGLQGLKWAKENIGGGSSSSGGNPSSDAASGALAGAGGY